MKKRYKQFKGIWDIFRYLFSHNRVAGTGSGIITLLLFTFMGSRGGASLTNVVDMRNMIKVVVLLLGQTAIGCTLVAAPFIWWFYGRKEIQKRVVEFFLSSFAGSGAFILIFTVLIGSRFDTAYTAGYSHFGFAAIQEGMSEQQVNNILQSPFIIREVAPYIEWVYAAEAQPQFEAAGLIHGTNSFFRFNRDGYLIQMGGVLEQDGRSYFGADHNYLGISTAEANQLIGLSRSGIREIYGEPTAVYQFTVVKLYEYSYSPSDTHYLMRQIGFDWTGKVVYKNDRIYWD